MTYHASRIASGALLAAAMLASACTERDTNTNMNSAMTDVATLSRNDWESVRGRTVFFAHQSVGDNILEGVQQIAAAERWPALRVVDKLTAGGEPALLHSKVGQNGDPLSKIRGFREALDAGAGASVEIAVMKFCFWDIRGDTDVDMVFDEYRQSMNQIAGRFPNLTLLHATVPLVVEDHDFRARLRRLLGRTVPTDADNAQREALNRKIRAVYPDRLFDIARAEQGTAPGTAAVPYLANAFSSDGAHLNDAGKRHVASTFVRSIAAATPRGKFDR